MEERKVFIDERIEHFFIDYDAEVTRIFLYMINSLQIKNRLIDKSFNSNFAVYNGIDYDMKQGDYNCIEIKIDEFKKFGIIKNKNKIDYFSINKLLHDACCKFGEFIYFYEIDIDIASIIFKKSCVFMTGDNDNKPYLTPFYKEHHRQAFITIDLLEFNQLRSRCQRYLYLKIKKFSKTGEAFIRIDDFKKAICTDIPTKKLIVKVNKAIEKLKEVTGLNIELTTVKKKREVTNIILKFE